MVNSLHDPVVEQQGIEKGKKEIAKEMLRGGEPIDKIVKYTRLSINAIEDLKREFERKTTLNMTKSLYDPLVEKQGIEIAKKAVSKKTIIKGMSNEDIKDLTDLSLEDIQNIREEFKKETENK